MTRRHLPRRALAASLPLLASCAIAVPGEPLAPDEQQLSSLELLGKRLFEDPALSEPPGQACASCHAPGAAFTGSNGSRIGAVALGSRPETFGVRNAPSLLYASFSPPFAFAAEADGQGGVAWVPSGGQFWDGRAATLAEQAKGPLLNPREMNNPDKAAVVRKVRERHGQLFRYVAGRRADEVDGGFDAVAEAIAAFEQTPRFHPFSSRFDEALRGGAPLDAQEARGFALFQDPEKGNCLACHAGDPASRRPEDWLFTDFSYDALGVPRNAAIPDNADPDRFDLGLCAQPGLAEALPPGTDAEGLCGAFKVPGLRNVARTAPYMHNGAFATLREVVAFYATRETDPARWFPAGRRYDDLPARYHGNVNASEVPYDRRPGEAPRLDDAEIDAIVAFLGTLSDR